MAISDSIIVNGLLCFISSTRHRKSRDFIIQSCLPFYDQLKVREAKDILFSYTKERPINRRGEDYLQKSYIDIIELFEKLSEDEVELPKFVADSFDTMPPCSGYEMISATMLSLIDQVNLLKDEIKNLKDISAADNIIMNDMAIVKEDLLEIRGSIRDVKMKMYGNEIRRLSLNNGVDITDDNIDSKKNRLLNCSIESQPSPLVTDKNEIEDENNESRKGLSVDLPLMQNGTFATALMKNLPTVGNKTNNNEVNKQNNGNKSSQLGFKNPSVFEVKNKYRKPLQNLNIIGTKKNVKSNLTPAPRLFDLYVGNCNLDINVEEI